MNANLIHALDADILNTAIKAQVRRTALTRLVELHTKYKKSAHFCGIYFSTNTGKYMLDKFPTTQGKKSQDETIRQCETSLASQYLI